MTPAPTPPPLTASTASVWQPTPVIEDVEFRSEGDCCAVC